MVDEKRHEEIEEGIEEERGSDHKKLKSIMKPPWLEFLLSVGRSKYLLLKLFRMN